MKKIDKILMGIASVLPILCGLGTLMANVISVIVLLITIYFFFTPNFFALTPIYIIYYTPLVFIGTKIAAFTVFCCLCIIRALLVEKTILTSDSLSVNLIMILLVLSVFVMTINSTVWEGVVLFIQIIAIYYVVLSVRKNKEVFETLKLIFICLCISAGLFGLFFENIKGNSYMRTEGFLQEFGRYSGTTSDPNYMAFYYCIAVCYTLFNKALRGWTKRIITFILFFFIATTGSLTGLLTFAFSLLIYVCLCSEVKKSTKILNVFLIFLLVGVFVWYVMSDVQTIPFLNLFRKRILEKISFLNQGDMSGVTTGRSDLAIKYIHFLFNQNPLRMLFGGYLNNAMGLVGGAAETLKYGAHNTYVDVLMTNGLLGLLVFVFAIAYSIIVKLNVWFKTKNKVDLGNAVYTTVVAFFIFGLSVYPAPCYIFFLLI